MSRYVAFLRGMNVGGRRISNRDLNAAFDEIGLPDASTFRASGNVAFDAPAGERRADLPGRIEDGLREVLGYEVPVFLRSAAETRAIAAFEPFPAAQIDASKGKVQVILLAAKPTAEARREALAHATDSDPLAIEGGGALLAAERRHAGLRPRPPSRRRAARRTDDDAHQGHDRSDRREVLRGLRGR